MNAVLSKTLERVVKEQLVEQLELKQVLDDRQFGFRNRRSTSQLLAVAANDWLLARDQGQTTVVVFIDLSKAFDCVPHQRPLVHLQSAGIAGTALSWFISYLSNRSRVVTLMNMSSYLPVSRGAPQGSVLGPTLFNLTVAQLPRLAENNESCLLMFADDKTLYACHRDPAKAAATVTKALDLLGSTLAFEGLSVNPIQIGCKLFHKPTLSVI